MERGKLMSIILSPSVLSADFGHLAEIIDETEKAGSDWIHIDVMDGVFVPNLSFGFPIVRAIRKCTKLPLDVHLMITESEKYIEKFIESGADIITFHAEATKDIAQCIDLINTNEKKAGLAIRPGTSYKTVLPYLDRLDMVLCMTVEPGYGGQKYLDEMNDKIRLLRDTVGNDFLIQVDGGITVANITEPIKAGANVIVAGSAVYSGSIEDNIKELRCRMACEII